MFQSFSNSSSLSTYNIVSFANMISFVIAKQRLETTFRAKLREAAIHSFTTPIRRLIAKKPQCLKTVIKKFKFLKHRPNTANTARNGNFYERKNIGKILCQSTILEHSEPQRTT